MLIGADDSRPPDTVVLRQLIHLAGKKSARILVLSTDPPDAASARSYARLLTRHGGRVDMAYAETAEQADALDLPMQLREQTAILILGASSSRLRQALCGSRLADAVAAASAAGLVIAGAGRAAALLGQFVLPDGIADGELSGAPNEWGTTRGLGLVTNVVADNHSVIRDRMSDVLAMLAAQPRLTAFGIERDTALVISPARTAHVLGKQSVLVIDGRGAWSDRQERAEGEIVTVTDCVCHTLAPGRSFDLDRRQMIRSRQEFSGRPVG